MLGIFYRLAHSAGLISKKLYNCLQLAGSTVLVAPEISLRARAAEGLKMTLSFFFSDQTSNRKRVNSGRYSAGILHYLPSLT